MTGRQPKVYLDVDGVLSPFVARSSAWDDWEAPPDTLGFDLPLSHKMAAAVVSATAKAEIVWATTWQDEAPRVVGRHFGWPEHRVLALPDTAPGGGWGGGRGSWRKLVAVRDDLEEQPGPFVWIDDDLPRHPEVDRWLARTTIPHLTVAPDREVGLTVDQIDTIRHWLSDLDL